MKGVIDARTKKGNITKSSEESTLVLINKEDTHQENNQKKLKGEINK